MRTSQPERIFTVYPLITIFAADEIEAAKKLYALNDVINATDGMSTELDEECYELKEGENDERWEPERV